MEKKEVSSKLLKTRLFRLGALLLVIVALVVALGVTQLNLRKSNANPAVNIVVGRVDLKVKNNTIFASMRLMYFGEKRANIPMAFHIHRDTAKGPVLYTGSISTDANGMINTNNVPMT